MPARLKMQGDVLKTYRYGLITEPVKFFRNINKTDKPVRTTERYI